MLNMVIYVALFIVGVICGRFLTITIRKKTDERIKNKKFPVLAVLTGVIFVVYAICLRINFLQIAEYQIISLILGYSYISIIILLSGIDRKKRYIDRNILSIGMIISVIYMIYLYYRIPTSYYIQITKYLIYICLLVILCIIDMLIMRKKAERNYIVQVLMLLIFMYIFSNEIIMLCVVIILTIVAMIKYIIVKLKEFKNSKVVKKDAETMNLHIGYMLGVINIIVIILNNLYLI